jgi:phage baseplate assembly protein W
MATVRLDNLIRPKQNNAPTTKVSEETFDNVVYSDLHLDLSMTSSGNIQSNQFISNDIKVDINENAIKNAVKNCIYTNKGEKVLDPDFGMDLDSYLFEPLSKERGNYIGRRILSDLSSQEPRINIIKIKVNVNFEDNSYGIMVFYEIPKINKKFSTDFLLKAK